MLHQTKIGLIVIGACILIFKNSDGADQQVTDAILILKQGDDRSRDCEAFERLIVLSPDSKRATAMVSEMYARGLCQPFDLEKSVEWYRKANKSAHEIGQALFYAARWEIPVNANTGPTEEQILLLLRKVKELGYTPPQNDLDRLPPEYRIVFE